MLAPTESPFLQAALNGDVAALERLLANGADVHEQDDFEQCALHFAAVGGELRIVELLLARGLSPNAKDQLGSSYDRVGMRSTSVACLSMLPSSAKSGLKGGQTALHVAARTGNIPLIKLLLDKGAQVNVRDNTHETPLHVAAWSNKATAVRELLDRGADVNILNQWNQSPEDQAKEWKANAVLEILRSVAKGAAVRDLPQVEEAKPKISVDTLRQLATALSSIPSAAMFEAEVVKEERAAVAAAVAAAAPAPTPAPPDFSAQVASLQRLRDELNKKEKELKAWEARLRDREASLELREAVLQEQEANALDSLRQRSAAAPVPHEEDALGLPQPSDLPPPPPPDAPEA